MIRGQKKKEKMKEEEKEVKDDDVSLEPSKEESKDSVVELAKAMAFAGILALIIRSFLFEPFNIPSESMLPTLLVGDYLFVEKYSYGYSKYSLPKAFIDFDGRIFAKAPKRGDIAVFRHPDKTRVDYIKRIIGLPGDQVQVRGGILNINGKPVMRDFRNSVEKVSIKGNDFIYKKYIETLPNGLQHHIYERSDSEAFDNTPYYAVPPGYLFVMGDNRDNSSDSRDQAAVGFIPVENLIGRAWRLFFSTEGVKGKCDKEGSLATLRSIGCKIIEYPAAIRYSRFFKVINEM